MPLRILASPGEHALATTAPRDLAAQAAAQQAQSDRAGPAATLSAQRWPVHYPGAVDSEGSKWQ